MAHFERDKDDVRVYDGSEDDEDGEGSHLPVVIIIAILVLAAFGGVVWLAYNQGVARGRNEPIRVATAETANAGNGIKVYQQPAGAEDEDEPAAKPAAATEPPQPSTRTQAAPPPATTTAQVSPPPLSVTAKPAATIQPPPQAQTATAPARPQPQPPAVATKPPAQLGLARPAPQTAAPPKAAATTAAKPAATSVKPAPTTATAAVKPVVPPKPVAVAASKPAAGAYLLQIGAYKSEAEATAAWKTYQGKHATLLAGFGPDVQRADLGDKGVWYRLRISSFADKDSAVALCERLKSQNGACFLAR